MKYQSLQLKEGFKFLFLVLLFVLQPFLANAQTTVSIENTEFDSCNQALPDAAFNLGNLVLSEGLISDFNSGSTTFYIQAPSNFEISANSITISGTDIISASVEQNAVDSSQLEITIVSNTQSSLDILTIENVQIQNVSSASSTNGTVLFIVNGANEVNGLDSGDILENILFNALSGGNGVSQEVCTAADVQNITVTEDNVTQNRTFEWQEDINGTWSTINDSNTESLIVGPNFSNGISRYRRATTAIVNGVSCTLFSTPAIITVNEIYAGSITEGINQTICSSQIPEILSTAGDVATTVGGTASYQWYKNDSNLWELINGATNTSYQPEALTITTSFRRRITNTLNGLDCFEETPAVTIVVSALLAGGTATNQNICSIDELQVLTINDGENNGIYQWQKNNIGTWENITNATLSTYNVSADLEPGVSEFRRVTTNASSECEAISTIATITYTNFLEGTIGGAQTLCYNESPNSFTSDSSASGSGIISYQWEQFDGAVWFPISGETNEVFQSDALTQTTNFRRQDLISLNGFDCSAYTNEIIITVLSEITGGNASLDQTLCEGELPTSLSITGGTSSGSGISYQWQAMTNGNFANIVGETGEVLDFSAIPSATTSYRRQTLVTDNSKVCTEVSTTSTVFVNAITAGIIGNDQSICLGETAQNLINLSPTTGAGTISYQWQQSTDNGISWTAITNENNATYNPGNITTSTLYRRQDNSLLNGQTCSDITNEISIDVSGAIEGGTVSSDQTVCESEIPNTLSISGGTPASSDISFQWQESTNAIDFTIIAGATSETLDFSAGILETTYYRREVIFSDGGASCSAFSTPTMVSLLTIEEGIISQDLTVCGDSAVPTLTSNENASSNGTIVYEWETSLDGDNWTQISSTNQPTYTPPITDDLIRYFRRKAIGTLNSVSCEAFTLPIIVFVNRFEAEESHEITFASGSTGSTTICNAGNPSAFDVNFTLLASGDVSYQWQFSSDNILFDDIIGATDVTYDPPQITADSYYRRITTSSLNGVECTVTSNTLFIENGGNASPGSIGTTNPNGGSGDILEVICSGDIPSALIETVPATGATLSYQWFANNVAIVGATSINYTPTNPITETTQFVRVTESEDISGAICQVASSPVTVLVPQGDFIGENQTICENTLPTILGDLDAIEGISYLDFQWYESLDGITFSVISGATSATYTETAQLSATRYYRRGYIVTVDAIICGPEELSNTIQIIINDIDSGTISENQEICFEEDPASFISVSDASASGVLTYQWFSSENNTDWNIIDSATNSVYDAEASTAPTTYFKRTAFSELNGIICSEDSNVVTVFIADAISAGTLSADQTVCELEVPNTLSVAGGSTFIDQSISWFSSIDGVIWTDIGVSTATYSPSAITQTTYYKRRVSRTSFGSITCFVETNTVTITLNNLDVGAIYGNQSVCQGDQPNAIVESTPAIGTGTLSYEWYSSPGNVVYSLISGANEANYLPPTTLTTSTYFKKRVTSSLNGVACFKETDPVLVTIIPYPIIANDDIISDDVTSVSCFGGSNGSIIIPNERITGGNNAQEQISTITLFGTPEFGRTYSIILNGIVYEHEVTLNGSNVTQTNDEIADALAQEINNAIGARLSEVIADGVANELILTAKIEGIPFTAFASTNSIGGAGASTVITQENVVGNTYQWTKTGDSSFTASTLSISDLTAGVYFLTIFNEFCSVTSEPILVPEPDELQLVIGDTCNTALTATISGGIAPFTFTLNEPDGNTQVSTSNNSSITYTGLTGGATYTISVTGSSCSIAESEAVTLPFGLQFDESSVVVNNLSCFEQNDGSISLNNGATTVTGGTAPFNFSWVGPNNVTYNTENISNLSPGVYVLTVTDQIGCSATYTANVASKQAIEITNVQVINEQLQCAGDNNAEIGIQVSADSNAQIQINWFKNGTSFATNSTNLTNLGAGSYRVVVTDINSNNENPCEVSSSFEIIAPEIFSAIEVAPENAICFDVEGQRDLVINVSGGTLPYQYEVDNGIPIIFNSTQITIASLDNESHIIEVTDSGACETIIFSLDEVIPISYNGANNFTIAACETTFPFILDTNLVLGGNPFSDNTGDYYLYEWRGPNGFVAQDITSFDAQVGTYFLTIIDALSCESQELEFEFTATYEPLLVDRVITPVSCGDDDDGAISIEISGGNRPYTIIWEQEQAGTDANPNPSFVQIGENVTQLNGLAEARLRLTISSNIPACNEGNSSFYYQEIISIDKEESLQLIDGPFLDDQLCNGNPGIITVAIFNAQEGGLSFYYDNTLVPSFETTDNTYEVQITNPVSNTVLNVVNDEGCGFNMPLNTNVVNADFSFSSQESDVTGLLLVNEDIRFLNTSETGYAYAEWDFGDGSPLVSVDASTEGTLTNHSFSFPGVFDVTLSVFNETGCSATTTQSVQIGSGYDVMFPDVFSPNSDGINDYFQGEFTGIASFTFQIYDTWGGLIFSASYDYDSLPQNWGWDGRYTNGKSYENPSFRYVFSGSTGDNTQITRTGEATIIR